MSAMAGCKGLGLWGPKRLCARAVHCRDMVKPRQRRPVGGGAGKAEREALGVLPETGAALLPLACLGTPPQRRTPSGPILFSWHAGVGVVDSLHVDCSTPGFPVLCLLEFAHTHVL